MPVRTSNFVKIRPVKPFARTACFKTTRSSQPQRRGRPVVEPNSPPFSLKVFPNSSLSSVGNGPAPTRVVYAFETPQRSIIDFGPTPAPIQAAAPSVLELVT